MRSRNALLLLALLVLTGGWAMPEAPLAIAGADLEVAPRQDGGALRDAWRRMRELASGDGPHKPRALALRAVPPPLRSRLIRAGVKFDERATEGVEVHLVSTAAELEACARLVHDNYVRRGIMTADPSGLRVTAHLLHPSTAVFAATRDGRLIGTISLAIDSPLGLPMEKIYTDEISRLRRHGRSIAEVGALALAGEERGQGVVHFLNKAMLDFARSRHVDDLVISVHPDAEDLYRATLMFERMGPVRTYPGLKHTALAAPLRLDLHHVAARMRGAYRRHDRFDAYRFYVVESRPEIKLPHPLTVTTYAPRRASASAALLAARPATVAELSAHELKVLHTAGVLHDAPPSTPEATAMALPSRAPHARR